MRGFPDAASEAKAESKEVRRSRSSFWGREGAVGGSVEGVSWRALANDSLPQLGTGRVRWEAISERIREGSRPLSTQT